MNFPVVNGAHGDVVYRLASTGATGEDTSNFDFADNGGFVATFAPGDTVLESQLAGECGDRADAEQCRVLRVAAYGSSDEQSWPRWDLDPSPGEPREPSTETMRTTGQSLGRSRGTTPVTAFAQKHVRRAAGTHTSHEAHTNASVDDSTRSRSG